MLFARCFSRQSTVWFGLNMASDSYIFCLRVIGLTLCLSYSIAAHRHAHHELIDNVKYSYGIFAPVGWTVGAYSWYIVSLGLILGAILLLYFSKGWSTGLGYFNRRSYDFQRTFGESELFDELDVQRDHHVDRRLFWEDRIGNIAKKIMARG
ncbi:uncharacterized protein LOC129764851 [Toxorhynchites rutilus septentrionalis]|uniref:uncharacterized protein LOC129764851 n=1 Tax=Toxorhynchites rutilus septentrionalis TaxID=329112 RepID=UPI002479A953|nr:uncharacterized protein LOC129764851 [Toxorhynchites rutilus septentrionalis]